jgi:CyaY protein
MLDEQQFRAVSESALSSVERDLQRAAEGEGFEVDRNQGALTIEFEDPPAKFVISPNFPVRQVWISARVKSFKLDWDADRGAFVLPDGRDFHSLIADLVSQQLQKRISL